MKTSMIRKAMFVLFFLFCIPPIAVPAAEETALLWQIGKPDRNNSEFALAPNQYDRFSEDGFFIVGQSEAKLDWPYAHPGPADSWAGGREHVFAIVFGLKNAPSAGQCKLKFDLLDSQNQSPPKLRIEINDRTYDQSLPAGAGDDSINGQPDKGKPYQFEIAFPAEVLKTGENKISIATVSGCWMLYDWLGLEAPVGVELAEVAGRTFFNACQSIQALLEKDGQLRQPIRINMRHIGEPADAAIRVAGAESIPIKLKAGSQEYEISAPAVTKAASLEIAIEANGQTLAARSITIKPVRKMLVYILPHSHTDIGYTDIQTAIEEKQMKNLQTGIEYARETVGYPEGARFIWNVEVLWAADLYLHRMSEAQRGEFFDAVKKGWVGLNGMYLNELTGLCRPEELLQLFRYSTVLAERCGVVIDSAMISDVPGYTWGTVTAMAQAGIKYFSTAPNYFDRIGDILVQWENKPFYWISPSGKEKVLVWIPLKGYALSHIIRELSSQFVADFQEELDRSNYPYDIAYLRWSGHGDNAVPDKNICEFVKDWNTKYLYPKFVITTTSEAFRAFEKHYGDRLPQVRGDWTPYWEDGAGSSALETAMNRATSDRLSQAEALWAMLNPSGYPADKFEDAWRDALLYSEHTWGAWCSVSDPENQMTKEQWDIKQSYALQADEQSRKLLDAALQNRKGPDSPDNAIDVFNTSSWPRTELVTLSKEQSAAGDRVTGADGKPVPSQRLANGELAFVARDVPPFASRRYVVAKGAAYAKEKAEAKGAALDNGLLRVSIDEKTGGIIGLRAKGIDGNFVDADSSYALNDYLYLEGDNLADLQRNEPVKISVKENGPLVASLLIESNAPGCNSLQREVRLVAGFDYVVMTNLVDKKRAPANPQPGDWKFAQKGGKESVNFAFPFHVPNGKLLLDVPLGAIQPEIDQMPSACKNWFTVGCWADASNGEKGITWVTLDAPLVEVGGITATLLGSQNNPAVWRKKVEPTTEIFSWAMNNHWGTNYRAYQEGPIVFRYALRPHRKFAPDEAARFAAGLSQPLIAARAYGQPLSTPRLEIEPQGAIAIAFKPSDDGKAWIVRLYGASGQDVQANLKWPQPAPESVWLSDSSEKPLKKVDGAVSLPAWEVTTLRAEWPIR
ncbi:MAG: polysaccharide lyase family protein [Candidatus Omnitrophota bacterium]